MHIWHHCGPATPAGVHFQHVRRCTHLHPHHSKKFNAQFNLSGVWMFVCMCVCVYLQIFPISLAIRRRALKHFLPCACQMAFSECVNWRDETPSKATHRSQMKMLKRRLKQHVTGARASQRVAAPVKQSHKLCRN